MNSMRLLYRALLPFLAICLTLENAWAYVPGNYSANLYNHDGPSHEDPGAWLGWGNGIYNNRTAAPGSKIDSSNVASLHLVCKKEYSLGVSSPPLVLGDIAYYPTWNGLLVALDYVRCNILWQTNITEIIYNFAPVDPRILTVSQLVSRTTPAVDGHVLYLGTQVHALLLAVDRRTGKLLDTYQLDNFLAALITQSPTVYKGRIFVGTASAEETIVDFVPNYKCCSFIAAFFAFSFADGHHFSLLWTQHMIPPGANYSGAAIWGAQPSIDPARDQVFIATGNIYSTPPLPPSCQNRTLNSTASPRPILNPSRSNSSDVCDPPHVYTEAILALDVRTGHINWVLKLGPLDAWTLACASIPGISSLPGFTSNPAACPRNPGPDADYGMAPSFIPGSPHTPHGKDTLTIGQKNGNLYALDAATGDLFWATATGPDGLEGGLIWGVAVDATAVFFIAANSNRTPWRLPDGTALSHSAFGAAALTDGTVRWEVAAPRNSSSLGLPTVVNDVVLLVDTGGAGFGTGLQGGLVALRKGSGEVLREVPLGGYTQAGVAVVREYVLFGTGYRSSRGSLEVWRV